MSAAPPRAGENPPMLEFDEKSEYDMDMLAYQRRPEIIAATLMTEPFMVSRGEAHHAQFKAGDYLCIGEDGPFGMPAEQFVRVYEARNRQYLDTYQAWHCGDGVIHLEPVA